MSRTFKESRTDGREHRIMGPSKATIAPQRAIKRVRHHRERRWASQLIRRLTSKIEEPQNQTATKQ